MNVSKWNEPSKFLIWSMIDCFSLGARPLTCKMSPRLSLSEKSLKRTPSFSVNRPGEETGVTFAGIPLGH
jgi:hypothetical protein